MTPSTPLKADPALDLVLERVIAVPREPTAIVTLEAVGSATRYTAMALHRDESERKRHEEMGFHEGWGKALDQLVAHAGTM